MEVASRFVEVDGRKLHCLLSGEGEPVVLLHGLPFCSVVWRKVIPALSESCQVIVPELPGIGRSDKPLDFDYSLPNLTAAVAGSLDALGLGPATLVGLDLGGTIALDLATHAQSLVSRLLILNTTVDTEYAFPWFHLFAARPSYYWEIFHLASKRGVKRILSSLVTDMSIFSEGDLEDYAACFADPAAVWALAKVMEAIGETPEEYLVDIRDGLARLEIPVDILWGERDEFLPVACGQRIQAMIPGASFEVVRGAGHLFVEERPENLLSLINKAHPGEGALEGS